MKRDTLTPLIYRLSASTMRTNIIARYRVSLTSRAADVHTLRGVFVGVGLLCACGGRTPLDLLSSQSHPGLADSGLGPDAAAAHCAWELAPQVLYPALMSPESVAAGDMDGDGHLDLVVGNLNGGMISVFHNQGDGTFAPQVTYKNFEPHAVALGDFDGDGRLDVVASNGNVSTLTVFRNVGGGKLDGGTIYAVGGYPNAIALADFDGDGHLDIASANNTGASVSILRNLGDGTFASQVAYAFGSRPEGIAVGDFDGDGHPDLAATNWGWLGSIGAPAMVGVLHNNGDGSFALQGTYTAGDTPMGLAAADFDGDGHLDLVVGDEFSALRVFLNLGDGTFAAPTSLAGGLGPTHVAVADFNRDGHLDIAAANRQDVTLSLFLGNGDGTFAPATTVSVGDSPAGIAAADLNGDGYPDLALASFGTDSLGVLLSRCR
jgi:hypothetical protein